MKNKLSLAFRLLVLLIVLYVINVIQQKNYQSTSSKLLSIEKEQINKILIQSSGEAIEILRVDTTWAISGHDSLILKQDLLNEQGSKFPMKKKLCEKSY